MLPPVVLLTALLQWLAAGGIRWVPRGVLEVAAPTVTFLLLGLVLVVRRCPVEVGMKFHPILMNPPTKKLVSGHFTMNEYGRAI